MIRENAEMRKRRRRMTSENLTEDALADKVAELVELDLARVDLWRSIALQRT